MLQLTYLVLTPFLAGTLLSLALIDLRERRLPDALTLPLALVGFIVSAWRAGGVPVPELVGAFAGFLVFWALGELYYQLRGAEGLGLGDAKLLGAAGAWLGWRDLPVLVLIAALGALVATLIHRPDRRDIAFGPWLAATFLGLWLARLLKSDTPPFEIFPW